MSENKVFTKARASDLSAELQQIEKKKAGISKRKAVMKRIIANMTMGNHEMINLFPDVCRLFETSDMEMKRMCYHYINTYALAKPELALSILSIVISDCRSDSPILVSLAVRNLASIPMKEYIRESVRPIRGLLQHKDAFLRKTACYGVARIYEKDPQLVKSEGLIDDLFQSLGDVNPAVVAAALTVLSDLEEKGNDVKLQLNKPQATAIADLLSRTDEWCQRAILNSLLNFVPQTHEDAEIMIDKTMPLLQHTNSSVVINAFKALLYFLNYVDHIDEYITKKLSSALTSILSKPAELQFLALRNVILLILSKPELIPFDVKVFFVEYNDPIYVKDTKLEIIYLLANESNLETVLSELEEYGTDVDVQMSRKAIRAIGNLAVKLDTAAKTCVDVLLSLASSGIDYVVQEAVMAFKNVLRKYDTFDGIVKDIFTFGDKVEEPEAKCALIWIVGQYCQVIPKSESVLADLTYTFKDDPTDVQLASLTAAVKLFIRRPEVGQNLVLKLLKAATENVDHPDVRDRGFFYWRLLSSQDKYPGTAKEVIDAELPPISSDNEQLDSAILEELELNVGTLASVYLKPVGQVFRLAKRKSVTDSPARTHIKSSSASSAQSRIRTSTTSSSTSSDRASQPERHIDDYDVPALNVKPVKKQSGLARKLTMSKTSLGRKMSIRGAFN
ncbi:CYFA0S03e01508g1_1 [Cyberlindnera fabianii]|uniref:AP complex subunit beta n=1 Tax=Cyberlindnera fabianii TaxID=36022 RepID=A0A061AX22_CYBFA|nr:CYFA0S03e01508g1_1 [Cyberlindnera fabianii]